MATKRIQNNEARVPFFGDKISFITGLDPLGLQNPSSRAYSYLLNGLNVVSRRIRNYSFYCWLLNEYAKKEKISKNPQIQKDFVRRAEYIIALSSVANSIEGMNGSNFASMRLEDEKDEITLSKGIYNSLGTTDGTYWKFPFGIFGQYYMGSMRQIRLIEEVADKDNGKPLGIYRITNKIEPSIISGEDLANAFANNIPKKKQELLISCIESDKVNREQLIQLFPEFNMFEINQSSVENELLIKMIMQPDDPLDTEGELSYNRRNSFKYVLDFTLEGKNELKEHNFTRDAYYRKGIIGESIDATLFGWYYYQFNEFFRLACTACLDGLLKELEEQENWVLQSIFIEDAVAKIIKELTATHGINEHQILKELLENDFDKEEILCDLALSEEKWSSISYATQLIIKLFQENHRSLKQLNEYLTERGINSETDVITFYQYDFSRYQEMSISEFLSSFLYNQVIYRHQHVAYRKMVGNQSTQKFIIEDNYIRHIGNFEPDFTASRIGTVIGFLKDLHLIDENDKVTTSGKQIIDSLNAN